MRDFVFYKWYCDTRDLHVLTHSFPSRRSSDLPLRLGADDHAFGDRRGAGCGVAVAPFHLDQAETAGTEALDAVGGAQLGDRTAQQRGGAHDADRKSTRLNSSH